jgi:hypothetical protein
MPSTSSSVAASGSESPSSACPPASGRRRCSAPSARPSGETSRRRSTIYLSIADFEGTTDGFGLTHANLRPRPAFHAFNGASRFGAYPPFDVRTAFIARGRLAVAWKTLRAASGTVRLEPTDGAPARTASSPAGTEHRVELAGLEDGRTYRLSIETTAAASSAGAAAFLLDEVRVVRPAAPAKSAQRSVTTTWLADPFPNLAPRAW